MARKSRKNIEPESEFQAAGQVVYNVGAYVRLSALDKKEKSDSIETQQAIISAFIAEHSDMNLQETYVDNGLSGQSFERPAFQHMLKDLENGKINCCITKDLSRLGRNAIDTGYYIEKHFPTHGIRFIAINDDYDSADGNSGGIMLSLKNMINEAYALDIGRKTRATKQLHIHEGAFVGKVPPYGYIKRGDDCHKLIPDSETAPVVKRIFKMYLEGSNTREIVAFLNNSGILPPYRYLHSKGLASEKDLGKIPHWSRSAVLGILRNRIYCGDMVQGKYIRVEHVLHKVPKTEWVLTENTHEAIVQRQSYYRVQDILCTKKGNGSRFLTGSSENIFRGKLFCGLCGYSLHRRRIAENTYDFRCFTNVEYDKHDCTLVSINEKDLKETILALLKKQVEIFSDNHKMRNNSGLSASGDDSIIRNVHIEIERTKDYLRGLYERLVSGDITRADFMDLKISFESRLASLEKQERQFHNKKRELAVEDLLHQKATENINGLRSIEDLSAKVINSLIERIQIFNDRSIEIQFSFADETIRGRR